MTPNSEQPFGSQFQSPQELPAKPKVSHTLHAIAVMCIFVVSWIVIIIGAAATGAIEERQASIGNRPDLTPGQIVIMTLFLLGMILTLVAYGMLIYRMWSAISPANATLNPGVATAIGIIPGVHLVGMFLAFAGLAPVINKDAAARGLTNVRISHGMAIAACVCKLFGVLGCIPIIGCIFALAAFAGTVLWLISLMQMAMACDKLVTRPVAYSG